MKKLIFITNMFPTATTQGKGEFVKNILNTLKATNSYDIELITLSTTLADSKLSKLISYFSFYLSILKNLFSYSGNAIFYIHHPSHTYLPFILFPKSSLVAHVHGGDARLLKGHNEFFFRFKRYICNRSFSHASKVIVPSDSYSKYISETYGVDKAKMLIYPSGGVSKNFSMIKEYKARRYNFAFVGRLEETKNIRELIKCFKMLNKNFYHMPLKFLIVGSGSLYDVIEKELLDCTDIDIDYYPQCSQLELIQFYNDCQILIYPSFSESLGLIPFEGIICGCLVVVTPLDTFLDYLPYPNYFIAKGFDSSNIYENCSTLLTLSSKEIEAIVDSSIEHIEEKLSSDNCEGNMIFFFSELYKNTKF